MLTDSTVWVEIVSATATPTAAVPPVESPDAVVVADAFPVAFASTLPVTAVGAPVPMSAELETFEIATATAGASETFGLDAPVVASVVIESTDAASAASGRARR